MVKNLCDCLPDLVFPAEDIKALSYRETLCKIHAKLFEVINLVNKNEDNIKNFTDDMTNKYNELLAVWKSTQEWITNWFNNIDIEDEFDKLWDRVVDSGKAEETITPWIIQEVNKQLGPINTELNMLNQEINNINTKIVDMGIKILEHTEKITQNTENISTNSQNINTLQTQIQNINTNMDLLNTRINEVENDINSINTKIANIESQLSNLTNFKVYPNLTKMQQDTSITQNDYLLCLKSNDGGSATFTVTSYAAYPWAIQLDNGLYAIYVENIIRDVIPNLNLNNTLTHVKTIIGSASSPKNIAPYLSNTGSNHIIIGYNRTTKIYLGATDTIRTAFNQGYVNNTNFKIEYPLTNCTFVNSDVNISLINYPDHNNENSVFINCNVVTENERCEFHDCTFINCNITGNSNLTNFYACKFQKCSFAGAFNSVLNSEIQINSSYLKNFNSFENCNILLSLFAESGFTLMPNLISSCTITLTINKGSSNIIYLTSGKILRYSVIISNNVINITPTGGTLENIKIIFYGSS